jgi:serine protease Do
MKNAVFCGMAGVGVCALALTLAPGGVYAHAGTQNSPKPSPQAAPLPVPAPSPDEKGCEDSRPLTEQFEGLYRSLHQNVMNENRARLQAELAKEFEMSSRERDRLRSLSDQFASNREELAGKTEELAAEAEALASAAQDKVQIIEQQPRVLIEADEESGWLGVEIGELTADKAKDLRLASPRGVVVSAVEVDSPAAKAGLKENDVITQYDGQTVEGTLQFRRLVRETPPGRSVTLGISRGGATEKVTVELGDRSAFFEKKMEGKMRDFGGAYALRMPNFDFKGSPEWFSPMADARTPALGISAEDLSGQFGEYFGAPDNAGVLVREVHEGTPAAKAGLKAGDVIIKVDGKAIRSLAELREQLRDKSADKPVNLGVLRRGAEVSLAVTIERPRPSEPMRLTHRAQL